MKNPTDMELLCYEQIACDMMNITAEEMFSRKRDADIVLARQFCIVLRRNHFKLSFRNSGRRYGRDHATALHANHNMDDFKDTKHINYKLYQDFLKKYSIKVMNAETIKEEPEMKLKVLESIERDEFGKYIKGCELLFKNMFRNIVENGDRKNMVDLIERCHAKIHEIQLVYEQLPELQDKVYINP